MKIQRPIYSIIGGGSLDPIGDAIENEVGGGGGGDPGVGFGDIILSGGVQLGLSAYEQQGLKDAASSQRTWQERMAGTAYQRSMLDMKLAGLNPILAYKTGGTPSGQGAMAGVPNYSKSLSSAVTLAKFKQELKNLRQGEKTSKMDMHKKEFEAKNQNTQAELNRVLAAGAKITNTINSNRVPGAKLQSEIDSSQYGRYLEYIKRGTTALPSLIKRR